MLDNMEIEKYVAEIKTKMISSPIIKSFFIVEEKILGNGGYFRARLNLINGDFLEVAEYFSWTNGAIITERYRYQWMNNNQEELRMRWDNVPHFPEIDGFPHHVHIKSESNVKSSRAFNILEILGLIEDKLGKINSF